jgi:hypothetical protein
MKDLLGERIFAKIDSRLDRVPGPAGKPN